MGKSPGSICILHQTQFCSILIIKLAANSFFLASDPLHTPQNPYI